MTAICNLFSSDEAVSVRESSFSMGISSSQGFGMENVPMELKFHPFSLSGDDNDDLEIDIGEKNCHDDHESVDSSPKMDFHDIEMAQEAASLSVDGPNPLSQES